MFLVGKLLKRSSLKTIWPNWLKFGKKHPWKVLYEVISKQNERWAIQAQPTVPYFDVLIKMFLLFATLFRTCFLFVRTIMVFCSNTIRAHYFPCTVSDKMFIPFAMLFILEGIYVFEVLFLLESISFSLHLLVRFYSVLRNFGKNGSDFWWIIFDQIYMF